MSKMYFLLTSLFQILSDQEKLIIIQLGSDKPNTSNTETQNAIVLFQSRLVEKETVVHSYR